MELQVLILVAFSIQQTCTLYLTNEQNNSNDNYKIDQLDIQTLQQREEEVQLHNKHKSYDYEDEEAFDDDIEEVDTQRKRREITDWFIAPNTHWCGRGNTANGTYNNLGGASAADKCCRKHDHCQHYILAFNTRYELFNYRPYTLTHCNCDRRFRTCLKMANDADANTIGKIFFNMVQTQCFVLRTQKVCQQRDERDTCVQHYIRQRAELRENKKF